MFQLLRHERWPAGRRDRAVKSYMLWRGYTAPSLAIPGRNGYSSGRLVKLRRSRAFGIVESDLRFFAGIVAMLALMMAPQSAAYARQPVPDIPDEADLPIAILYDAGSGQILHQRNADRRFMPASITKVMSAYVAFGLIDAGVIDPRQRFTMRPATFAEWGGKGSTMFLQNNAHVSVASLLRGITTVSANDGAIVLAEGASGSVASWAALMNQNARNLGMMNSHFASPNGWMDEGQTFTTGHDLIRLADAMIRRHPALYHTYIGRPEFHFGGITQHNRDPMIGRFQGADGIKTGFTNEAGFGYVGSAIRNGRRLIMVVAGADSARLRNKAARDYMEWGFSAFDVLPFYGAGDVIGVARVQDGSRREVGLVADHSIHISAPQGTRPHVTMRIHYDGPIRAPIAKGETVAELEIEVEGMGASRIPLQAADNVTKANAFERVLGGIAGWIS